MTVRGTIIWLICAFFFLYEFFLRTVLGTFQSSIILDLHLSAVQFAIMSSTAYQIIYGLMQLPVGIIADRYGLKKTLLFAALVCSVSNLGFSFVHNYQMALLFRLFMGLGSSFGFVCLLLAVYDWLPRKNIAFFIGLSQFIGTLGPMLAAGPLNALLETNVLGWRELFLVLALIGGIFSILVFCFVDKNREEANSLFILARPSSLLSNLYQLVRQKQVWWIGFYSSSVYFSLEYLSENEGISFLMAKGHSATFAAYLITIAWLGYAIGCPVLGFLSDKLKQRKPSMLFSIGLVLFSLSAIIYLPLNPLSILLCFFLLGIGASGQSLGFAIISEYCQSSYLTIGLAFNNTLIMFFGAVSAPLISTMLERGATAYPLLVNYQMNFSLMIAFIFIGVILSFLLIKETFCKQVHEITMLSPKLD
ncbi:MFS transporter [Legionella jordanis]|uniref:Major facilitator superfamily (MFS) transporter n=1 Tax=Legionella jordanis TaxID=456 RepID=A0A0W0VG11_9GAMM|nr:MFS transporter [Legionella jordanis]KTD19086.1 major facilitator superfamily (MFS) transporter [Legionella jordanis]RMW99316.1 MFS transporter [Legionella jordanis]VEH12950.1 major facilitator superfamily (MFS) transporter [Legionella jordanis]